MTYKIKQLTDRINKGLANDQSTVHDILVIRAMQTNRLTPDEIAEGVSLTGLYTTKDPIVKSVKWHLNKLEKEGVIEQAASTPSPTPETPVVKAAKQRKAA